MGAVWAWEGGVRRNLRPSPLEETLPRLLWELFLRNAASLAQHGGDELSFTLLLYFFLN